MELTNEQREYLGLELIDLSWECMEILNNSRNPELSTGKDVLFFDGDVLRKVISFVLSMTAGVMVTDGFCLMCVSL